MSILQIIQNVSDLSEHAKRRDEELHKKYGLTTGITLGDPASEAYLDEAEKTDADLVNYLNTLDVSDIKKLVTLMYAGRDHIEFKEAGSLEAFHQALGVAGVHDRSKDEYIRMIEEKIFNLSHYFSSAITQLNQMGVNLEISLACIE